MTPISVLLPVHGEAPHLAPAIDSVLEQTHGGFELLILLNGAAPSPRAIGVAREAARRDPRVRVHELLRPRGGNLSTVLNEGLALARHGLVARMDADDLSHPERLGAQAAFMERHPGVLALGTAYERIDERGGSLSVVVPPCDPGEIRWRLLLGNTFAHGSMMLRRDAVLAAGGYDESCARAQDYELWTRLARPPGGGRCAMANLPRVLYRYRTSAGATRPDVAQGETVARVMLREWALLGHGASDADLAPALARMLTGGAGGRGAAIEIERALNAEGPSVGALLGHLVGTQPLRGPTQAAIEAGRLSRLREVSTKLRWFGVTSVWLWGAGRHTEWMLAHEAEIPQQIVGVADDLRAGTRLGLVLVQSPHDIPAGADVLLSSDAFEDELWEASAPHRARGVRVWRFYGAQDDRPTIVNTSHAAEPVRVGGD